MPRRGDLTSDDLDALRARASAARAATRGPRRDVLPGARAVSTWPRSRPRSAGTTGPSSTRGPGLPARSAVTCWCPPPASTASPRAGCSPTWTATAGRSASSRATPSTRARAAATAPRDRPPSTRSPIPTASCTRCAGPARAAAAAGSGSAGTRRWTRSPRRIRAAIIEQRQNEIMIHLGPARRRRIHRAGAGQLGRGRAQLAHQRVLQRRADRLPVLDGRRPAKPGPRERQGHLPHQRAPGSRALLQSACATDNDGPVAQARR